MPKTVDECRILMLAVDTTVRKQGHGNALLRHLIRHAPTIRKISLEVRTDNSDAISFYKKNGFIIKEKVQNFYTDDSPAYRMEKRLL
jgi:ribosomal protein S18 acetylase RimI-like enzyme